MIILELLGRKKLRLLNRQTHIVHGRTKIPSLIFASTYVIQFKAQLVLAENTLKFLWKLNCDNTKQ